MRRILFTYIALLSVLHSFAQNTEIRYLSGTGNDNTVDWQFYCTEGRNSGKWTTIPVPSCWELQGFGKYNYGFNKDSAKGKEKGLYKYTFKVPSDWKNKVVNIVFEGSMTDTDVKINGKVAGAKHQGSFYVFKHDISKLLKYGKDNLLEVTVAKHSDNKSVNEAERKADFWIFGGIFRPVYLEMLPQQHIDNVAVNAKANGDIDANVFLSKNNKATEIRTQLFSLDGRQIGSATNDKIGVGDTIASIKTSFKNIKQWTPETPDLYNVVFTLVQNGNVLHTVSKRIGFRTVEVKERDGIYVNGVKVKMKGVNRHSFWPTSGRATSKGISIADVLLMKEMNMNAVRMSHYPPDGHFLDVCDSLGLFVMDELAGWHGHYDTPTGKKLLKEMFDNDENHPSIIFWANGNEGGHNLELDPYFRQWDIQHRPVIHPWQVFSGFDTQHYRDFDYGIGNYMHGHNIVMPTEFLHGMYDGGHGAGLYDYWEEMWRNPICAGGFLWVFADEGVVRTDKGGIIDTDKEHAPDGIVGPYHEKEGSFFTIKEVWSPIFFERKDITPAFDGSLKIENRYYFTNVNQCSLQWKLQKLGGVNDQANLSSKSGTIAAPDIKPSEKGSLKIDLPADWQNYDVLYVTAKDPFSREIFTWSFKITLPSKTADNIVKKDGSINVEIEKSDSLYIVNAATVQLTFSRNTGLLKEVKNDKGIIPFNNGPIVDEGATNFAGFTDTVEGDNIVIRSTFDRKQSYNTLEWTIYPSGWIKMKVNYFPAAYLTDVVGVNFSFPEYAMKSVKYMGDGPYRVWKNRMKGTQFGVWEKEYNNTATGEVPFVYPEFKGYYANMYWCKFFTSSQNFTVITENEDLFLRLFTPKVSKDPYQNFVPVFPGGDISFMQGISAIGTKTQKPLTTGVMAQKNIFYDYEKEKDRALAITLYFDFTGK
ncbi:glycoside hydrolase family 2 protein [Pinibacter soli]|uniref:beta-galactosidase n=1 Tax=Pinibacter soli TaxID=3044211 RepID=A0ABT6REZ8_9BACT|nr:glycoside hydrolase family 2 TIM barrel-domain containing protein [Pinibacter soli]MDI3321144.1 glycoside hydrolase family 2 TIM barrel-domain containing protein [Pinibacter soli]